MNPFITHPSTQIKWLILFIDHLEVNGSLCLLGHGIPGGSGYFIDAIRYLASYHWHITDTLEAHQCQTTVTLTSERHVRLSFTIVYGNLMTDNTLKSRLSLLFLVRVMVIFYFLFYFLFFFIFWRQNSYF